EVARLLLLARDDRLQASPVDRAALRVEAAAERLDDRRPEERQHLLGHGLAEVAAVDRGLELLRAPVPRADERFLEVVDLARVARRAESLARGEPLDGALSGRERGLCRSNLCDLSRQCEQFTGGVVAARSLHLRDAGCELADHRRLGAELLRESVELLPVLPELRVGRGEVRTRDEDAPEVLLEAADRLLRHVQSPSRMRCSPARRASGCPRTRLSWSPRQRRTRTLRGDARSVEAAASSRLCVVLERASGESASGSRPPA